uniref:nucleoside hydrolase n=1 Tax=Paenirhodobacter enshiensis TaxID=1105367 RepID=UPI0035B49EC5
MQKVIFDTDPGVDDALALLYLHRHPGIELRAVTTVFGNAAAHQTARNAAMFKHVWGFSAPVAMGAEGPLNPSRRNEDWPVAIHGQDGLGDIGLGQAGAAPLDPRPAHRLIVDEIRACPGEITLIAVGRMTNLALALQEAPDIAQKVRQVVLMGGAFGRHGNVTPAAEANIWGDPEAADAVFGAEWPVVAVGLDVTMQVVMTRAGLNALGASGGAPARMVRDLSQGYVRFYEGLVPDGMVVHDACACVFVTDPQLFGTRRGAVRVLTEGIGAGMTVLRPEGIPFPPGAWDGIPVQTICDRVDAAGVLGRIAAVVASRG